MRRETAGKFLARLQGTGAPEDDFIKNEHRSINDLGDYGTHWVNIKIQGPQKRGVGPSLNMLDVFLAIEGVIDHAGLNVEVFSQDFLLKKGVIVAALQEFVEVRNLLEQVTIFERTGKSCLVTGAGIRNELTINQS